MKGNITAEELIAERKRIGNLLRELREQKGLTQQELSEQLGISRSTIPKIEDGKWNFGIDTLTLFQKYLQVKVTSETQL